jgi:hypothetical protein
MPFTDTFTGATVIPTDLTYKAYSFSADLTLYWPEANQTSTNVVYGWMDFTPSTTSLSVIMPDARQMATGLVCVAFNAGGQTFTLKDADGGTIQSIAAGAAYDVVLKTNSANEGTWRTVQRGASTHATTAADIDSTTVVASAGTLVQAMPVTEKTTSFTAVDGDRGSLLNYTGGAGTATMSSVVQLGTAWFCGIRNSGSGALVIDGNAAETIDEEASITINVGDSTLLACDGSGFWTLGRTSRSSSVTTFPTGSAAAPGLTPDTDLDTGLYRISANSVGISCGGALVGAWSTAGLSIAGTFTASGVVALAATRTTYAVEHIISAATTDASDTLSIKIAGGGDVGATRGAQLELFGNEGSSPGVAVLASGSTANALLRVNGTDRIVATNTGATLVGAAVVTGTQTTNNTADSTAVTVNGNHASLTASIVVSQAARTASSAYKFFAGISDSDGTPDTEFYVGGDGVVAGDQAYTTGADYAEMFEWEDGNPSAQKRRGLSVVLTASGKIRPAVGGDPPASVIGVVSPRPSLIGDSAELRWKDYYLTDEAGDFSLDPNGERVVNPNFDPGQTYIPRLRRPEWAAIGLLGKLRVRKGLPVGNRWVKIRDISASVEEWLVR